LKLYAGDYCRSCSYYIRRGLDRLKEEGLLDEEHPLAVVVGRDPEAPEDVACPVAILGDCALASGSVKPLRDRLLLRGKLHAVYACPPMEFRVRAAEMLDLSGADWTARVRAVAGRAHRRRAEGLATG
jgi:hypothetical protein